MLEISSTDILIMDVQDMTDALKHPHPTFADIFKNKFQKPLAPKFSQQSPVKAPEIKRPEVKIQPVLRSSVKYAYQTRSNMQLNPTEPNNITESQNSPQLPSNAINKKCSTSEGASRGVQPFSQKLFIRFLGYEKCQS
jgi:hypothetical protein